MITHLHRWLISALCCLAVAAAAGEFEDGLEKIGHVLAIPNTRDARQLQVTMPDVGMRLDLDFLPNGGQRSFGRSLRGVVWLWSANANRLDMVDIWGRELEVPLPSHLGGDTVRFKPVSTRDILDALAAEYRALAALPPDPELPIDVSGGLGVAVHLQRRGETAAAAQVIRWCQALDRRPLLEITRDALQVCYDAHYLFAWESVRVYGDWRTYEDTCDDILKRPSATHWHHAEALRARLPQIEARAIGAPTSTQRGPYTSRDLKQLVETMDRTGNDRPDTAWPIAILGDTGSTAYRKRHVRQPLQMTLFRQGIDAIPHLVALLGDTTLVPLSDSPVGVVGLPMSRGDVARRTLLATLPDALPPTISDADLTQQANDFYRLHRQRSPVDLAVLLLTADPARFEESTYAMLTETMPHDKPEVHAAIASILLRHARDDGTLWPDDVAYFRGLRDRYRGELDRYMTAYAAGLADADTQPPATQATVVRDARMALLKLLAVDSDAALVEYLARHPTPLVGRSSGVDARLARARDPILREILTLLADPTYRDGGPELVAAFEVVARRGAAGRGSIPVDRLQLRPLRREWRAALAADERVVVDSSMLMPVGQYLALSVERLLATDGPTYGPDALPVVREAVRQRALARIEGLADDLLPAMPDRIPADDPRYDVLIDHLAATTAENLPAFLAALAASEMLTLQHLESAGNEVAITKLAPRRDRILAVQIAPRLAASMAAEETQFWLALRDKQMDAATIGLTRNHMSGRDLRLVIRAGGAGGGTDLLVLPNDDAATALRSLAYDRRWLVVAAIDVPTAEGKSTTMLWQSPDTIQPPAADADVSTSLPLWQGVDLRTMVNDYLALPEAERTAMAATWQEVTDAPDTWGVGTVLTIVAYAYGPDVADVED